MNLPNGVLLKPLIKQDDNRGSFSELFRCSWAKDFNPIQWNAVHSEKNVLRGVHVHKRHTDYLTVIKGRVLYGLNDMRENSSTYGESALVEIHENDPKVLFVPPGVAHGFYFLEPSIQVYSVDQYWDVDDELGCHFLDPDLKLDWPNKNPVLSERDKELPTYQEVISQFREETWKESPLLSL